MLITMSNYGKVPDPVIALARDAARMQPGRGMGGVQTLADQPDRVFFQRRALWVLPPELRPKGPPPGAELNPVFGTALQEYLRDKGLEGYPNWAQGNQVLSVAVTTYGCYWKWFGSEKVSAISRFLCLFEGIFVVVDLLSNHPQFQQLKPAWEHVKAWLTVIVVVYKTGEEVHEMMHAGEVKKPHEIVARASDPRVRQLVEGLRSYSLPLRQVNLPVPPQDAAKGPSKPSK